MARRVVVSDEESDATPGRRGAGARATNIATVRVLEVLSMFALEGPAFGVTELSKRLGLTKNMVHRALVTLVEQGFLVRDATGSRYELGFGVFDLQNPNFPAPDFRTLAGPVLSEIHAETGMTTQLSIRVGDNQVVIDGVEAFGPKATRPKIGSFFPLHASAASRAILACLPDAEIDDYIRRNAPLRRYTERTLVMPQEIRDEVARVRRAGYAESYEDYNRGSSGFSFPVPAANGRPHGAITVGGPRSQMSQAVAETMLPRMLPLVDRLRREAALYDAN